MDKKRKSDITFDIVCEKYSEGKHGVNIIAAEDFTMTTNGKMYTDFVSHGIPYQYHYPIIMMVKAGRIDDTINMEDVTCHAGDIMLMKSYTIIETKGISSDFDFVSVGFNEEVLVDENIFYHASQTEMLEMDQMFQVLWTISNHKPFRKETVRAQMAAIVSNFKDLAYKNNTIALEQTSGDERICKRFKELVCKYADRERDVAFYADQLCVSSNYLSKVVSRVSGSTVTQWINRATVLHAKVLLKTTDLMTYQIADQLNFTDQATFSKFFKRETGISPREFRKGK